MVRYWKQCLSTYPDGMRNGRYNMHIEVMECEADAENGVTEPRLEIRIAISNIPKHGAPYFAIYAPIDSIVYIAPESTHPHGAVIIER